MREEIGVGVPADDHDGVLMVVLRSARAPSHGGLLRFRERRVSERTFPEEARSKGAGSVVRTSSAAEGKGVSSKMVRSVGARETRGGGAST